MKQTNKNKSFEKKDLARLDISAVEVQKAKEGNIQAAKALLKKAASYLTSRKQMPDALKEWLSNALIEISEGTKHPDEALCLKKKPGRISKISEETQELIALSVHELPGLHKSGRADGSLGAYAEVGERFGLSPTTIEKIYRKNIDAYLLGQQINDEIKAEASSTYPSK